ncbi:DUF3813 family protein [Alkalihalobacillus sp. 1P02AB]|uniref:DUF3813 family protein n=1 Tax=Alkalihalobacillus sp. 1P02AB TaxID=3132260 RepID=UPI0039A412A7
MVNSYQQAREAVARAELLTIAAETDIQREAANNHLEKAKSALQKAALYATEQEQKQLTLMKSHISTIMEN